MKNLSSWLIAIFAFMFWGFRAITTLLYSIGREFISEPMDITMEIALLFITFICICFIARRKILPVTIYLVSHTLYYGIYLYQNIMSVTEGTNDMNNYISLLVALVGIAIPIFAFLDVLLDKSRKANPVDKETDWFYKNEQYDRKIDERSDKNQYRTM